MIPRLVDFHAHFFPDAIAAETVRMLGEKAGVPWHGDGTLAALLRFMQQDGVDLSVNLPVATRPAQVRSINRRMVEINAHGVPVVCFGAMHPDVPDVDEETAFLAAHGVRGIKLHTEYQGFFPDDPRLAPLYESCARRGLIILFHTGVDLGYEEVHTTPARISQVLKIPGLKVVLAHMGGFRMWEEVGKHLAGSAAWFDLAYTQEMHDTLLQQLIRAHGAHRILFGTDFPWERASVIRDKVERLGLSAEERELIYARNACELLGIVAAGERRFRPQTAQISRSGSAKGTNP